MDELTAWIAELKRFYTVSVKRMSTLRLSADRCDQQTKAGKAEFHQINRELQTLMLIHKILRDGPKE